MRILCILVSVLGLLLLVYSWRGWTAVQHRRASVQEIQQTIIELQRLVQMHDRRIQSLPADFTSHFDDTVAAERDWSVVAIIGAMVFLAGVAGIFIQRRLHEGRAA